MAMVRYSARFFSSIEAGSLASARAAVPELLALLNPRSVVDVGCGTGAWLRAFQEGGVNDILGIDGDYVERRRLLIPSNRFVTADVAAKPLPVERQFDAVLSLEVAEHIAPERSDHYLDNLAALGDCIVFSAAVPSQGGTGHVNEQWPEYWRDRFAARGFFVVDCLRARFWNNREIERWYRQNLLLFVKERVLRKNAALTWEWHAGEGKPLSVVHPATYVAPSVLQALRMLRGAVARAVKRRWKKR